TFVAPISATQMSGNLVPGVHTIEALYSGDVNFADGTAFTSQSAKANAFGTGDLLIYRVGDGGSVLTANGNDVFIDEYNTAGTLQQSIALPIRAGSINGLIASGTASSEGELSLSTDGQYVLFTGYNAAPADGVGLAGSHSNVVNRVV